jgi:hypothetical protein
MEGRCANRFDEQVGLVRNKIFSESSRNQHLRAIPYILFFKGIVTINIHVYSKSRHNFPLPNVSQNEYRAVQKRESSIKIGVVKVVCEVMVIPVCFQSIMVIPVWRNIKFVK